MYFHERWAIFFEDALQSSLSCLVDINGVWFGDFSLGLVCLGEFNGRRVCLGGNAGKLGDFNVRLVCLGDVKLRFILPGECNAILVFFFESEDILWCLGDPIANRGCPGGVNGTRVCSGDRWNVIRVIAVCWCPLIAHFELHMSESPEPSPLTAAPQHCWTSHKAALHSFSFDTLVPAT